MMGSTVTIIHAADLHLDPAFEGLPEEKAALRRSELRRIPDAIARLAESRSAAAVLLAGDMFDSDEPYRDSVEALFRALGGIKAPVFISPGNHDFYNLFSPYAKADIPENVHIFTSGSMECVSLPEPGVRVWGAAFTDGHSPSLLDGFSVKKQEGVMDIAVIHGDAVNPASPYGPVTAAQIADSGLDYLALGHIHGFSGLKRAGDTYYAWPGCCAGRGFDETGEKGVCVVTLSPGACELEFVPLGGRKYGILTVDVTGSDALEAVSAALPHGSENDILRVILTGETDAPPDPDALHQALDGRAFFLQLRDSTTPKRDIWAGCGVDTLQGLFLSRLHGMLDTAGEEQRRRIELAARYGLAALENGEAPTLL